MSLTPRPPVDGGTVLVTGACARDALVGFDRGVALVFPGRAYRIAMTLLPLVPRRLQREQAARAAARLRRGAGDARAGG